MSATSTVRFEDKTPALFSIEEMRELMWIEFERAKRYDYPLTCMMIQVDRLRELENVHGYDVKLDLLRSVAAQVRAQTRNGDLLTCFSDDHLTALFPHTGRELAEVLAQRILKRVRSLQLEASGRSLRITLSIGLSHSQHPHARSFSTLLRVAEEGLSVADAGGGDRCIETELYQLIEEHLTPAELGVPEHILRAVAREGGALVEGGPESPAPTGAVAPDDRASVEERARELAEEQLRALRESQLSSGKENEYLREIDVLERRIAKLTNSLGLTEQELQRLRQIKGIDPGISSIYREVQGLDGGDPRAGKKRELMEHIFAANLELLDELGALQRRGA